MPLPGSAQRTSPFDHYGREKQEAKRDQTHVPREPSPVSLPTSTSMRPYFLVVAFVLWLNQCCFAWDKFDHEVFDLVGELAADNVTDFYSWLDVPSTSSASKIAGAYRKLSKQLQLVALLSRSSGRSFYLQS